MMLIDTDVLIDIALDRRPHSEPASELLDRAYRARRPQCIHRVAYRMPNFYYLVAPSRGGITNARDFIVELTRFVEVAPTDTQALHYAAELLANGRLRGCDASRVRRTVVCRPIHRHQKRQGLRSLANPRDHPVERCKRPSRNRSDPRESTGS